MRDRRSYQTDLFETPAQPRSIPSHAEIPMLELLKALLTEALIGDNAEYSAAIWVRARIAAPELFPNHRSLPRLKCSRRRDKARAGDEAGEHQGYASSISWSRCSANSAGVCRSRCWASMSTTTAFS